MFPPLRASHASPTSNQDHTLQQARSVREILKFKTYKIYPSKSEKARLTQMFITFQEVYNKLRDLIHADIAAFMEHTPIPPVTTIDEFADQWWGVTQDQSLANFLPIGHLLVPQRVREAAFFEVKAAFKNAAQAFIERRANGNYCHFPKVEYKVFSERDGIDINLSDIEIDRTVSPEEKPESHVSFFPAFFKWEGNRKGLCVRDHIPEVYRSVRLQRSRNGNYYLEMRVMTQVEMPSPTQVCALAPGSRHFVTLYDSFGRAIAIDDFQVKKSRRAIMRAEEERPFGNKRERYRTGVRIRATIARMAQREEAMQLQLASWLAESYSKVLLPQVHSLQMENQPSGTNESLASSHQQFRSLLEQKLARMGGVLLECSEENTTQTCTRCGAVTEIGSAARFKCPDCRLKIDKDVNAARNIFLMNEYLAQEHP